MAKARKISPRKESLYNKVSKRFTAINNKLPEEQKLSIQRRRQIMRQSILPALSTTPKSKIRIKVIKGLVNAEIAKIPSRDPNSCNLNYIDPSNYAYVEWFEIDEFLQKMLPDCIFVKVSAGHFGHTDIFNTRNYNYYNKGINEITDKIRSEVDNKSGEAWYQGYQRLRPRKKNDGKSDSYYLELLLFIQPSSTGGANPAATIGQVTKFVPKGADAKRKAKSASNKVNTQLDKIFSKLAKEKAKKSRAYRTVRKDETKITKISKRKITDRNVLSVTLQFGDTYEKSLRKLNKYLERGLITQARYDKGVANLQAAKNRFNDEN